MRKLILTAFLLILLIPFSTFVFAQDTDMAQIRAAHLAPGADEVDVYLNGEASGAIGVLDFGDISGWISVPAGTYSVAVAPAGTSLNDAIRGPINVDLSAGSWVTLAAVGAENTGNAGLQAIVEDFSPIATGETRVTLFNALASGGRPINLQVGDDNVLIQTLGFPGTLGDNDGVASVDIVSGTYDLAVTFSDNPDTTLATFEGITLAPGKHYFITTAGLASSNITVIVDTELGADVPSAEEAAAAAADEGEAAVEEETSDEADAVVITEGDVAIRVAHFAPGIDEVDIYINGEVSSDVGVLDFGNVSEWVSVPSGSYSIAVAPAGTSLGDAVIGPVDVALNGGDWVTLAAVGAENTGNAGLQAIVEDFSPIAPGETRVTLFNALASGDSPINLQLADGTTLIQTLGFPGTLGDNDGAGSVDIISGTYDLNVTLFNDPDTSVATFDDITLAPGKHYFIGIAGLASSNISVIVDTEPAG